MSVQAKDLVILAGALPVAHLWRDGVVTLVGPQLGVIGVPLDPRSSCADLVGTLIGAHFSG